MALLQTLLFIVAAIALFWAFGYAHELAYAKVVKRKLPKSKSEYTPLLVRGYIWGMGYMAVSLYFFA